MRNDASSRRDDANRDSGQPGQVAPTDIITVTTDVVTGEGGEHPPRSMQQPHQPEFVATNREGEMKTARDRAAPTDLGHDRIRPRGDHEDRPRDDADRAPGQDAHDRSEEGERAQPPPAQPARMKNLLVIAAVGLVSGTIGAMGYSYIFGPGTGDASSSLSRTKAGSNQEASSHSNPGGGSPTEAAQGSSTPESTSTSSSIPGFSSAHEAKELKERITGLNRRIDQMGERIDRLQELLSLAVPIMQRIAPKH
ncbi:MAG: hypothetical protein ACLQIB_45595 [Isosphaeraceae bacterium]